ncbi:MAG: sialidase family protein [Caldilinea sp.]
MDRNAQPFFVLLVLLLSAGFLIFLSSVRAHAQDHGDTWSSPEELFREDPGQYTNELWLLRDRADSLYLWWPVFLADTVGMTPADIQSTSSVFHTEWQNGPWQEPRDVLTWPKAGFLLTSAVIDDQGTIHAFSPTDCLSYSSVPHDQAMNARSWSERTCVDSMGSSNVAVAIDDSDVIYLAYAAPQTRAMRVAVSVDGGVQWSTSDVATTQDYYGSPDGYFTSPDLAIDQNERLHLVWSPVAPPDGTPYLGVLYSRSDDGGLTWTPPVQLGQEHEGQAAIAVHEDEVHVLWNGDASKRGRYYRYSNDAGATWSTVEKLGDDGGLQRPPALIVDNVGNLHAMLHEQDKLYYIAKIDSSWTEKSALYLPSQQNAFEVFAIRLAITGGTQLHAVYTLLPNDGGRVIFHQSREIDAEPETPIPWPAVAAATATLPAIADPSSTATPTPIPARLELDRPVQASRYSQGMSVAVGAFAAFLLTLGVIVVVSIQRRQS